MSERKMTIAILGLGSRGLQVYAPIIKKNAAHMELVAVADIDRVKLQMAQREYGLSPQQCFDSADELLHQQQLADVLFICTQDRDHVSQAIAAIKKGYHILLEKPVSPDKQECEQLQTIAQQYHKKVCVCHVLRYTPFYSTIKQLLASGVIGKVMTIQAREDVGFFHQAHSFVRGHWRDAEQTSPMILAKCCHDMDILVWLADAACQKVSSFGELSWFKADNAPPGAAKRCLENCQAKEQCPYDAEKIYITNPDTGIRFGHGWPANSFVLDTSERVVLQALKEGPYGRCVYACDNNVVDHQVVNMEMKNGITITFSMCAFSATCDRSIKIMGTMGQIEGTMSTNTIYVTLFGKETRKIDLTELTSDFSGHGGGDSRMIEQLYEYLINDEKSISITELDVSLESHYIALAAETSRIRDGAVVLMR